MLVSFNPDKNLTRKVQHYHYPHFIDEENVTPSDKENGPSLSSSKRHQCDLNQAARGPRWCGQEHSCFPGAWLWNDPTISPNRKMPNCFQWPMSMDLLRPYNFNLNSPACLSLWSTPEGESNDTSKVLLNKILSHTGQYRPLLGPEKPGVLRQLSRWHP